MSLTAERVREVLAYCPETGQFTWRIAINKRIKPGRRAGVLVRSEGRVNIAIDGQHFKAHRLAWLHVHGVWPDKDVDHINGDPSDNRVCNLRLATKTENHANSKRYKNNKSGFKGVHFHAQSGKWRAVVRLNRKNNHIGLFRTKEDAAAAYLIAATKLFGEFATSGDRSPSLPDK